MLNCISDGIGTFILKFNNFDIFIKFFKLKKIMM